MKVWPVLLTLALAFDGLAATAVRSVSVSCRSRHGSFTGSPSIRRSTVRPPGFRPGFRPEILPICQHAFEFRMDVTSDDGFLAADHGPGGRPLMRVRPGQRYRVTLHNPLPVAVAVNLTVDGLNTLTGAPSRPESGSKWLIPPSSSVQISGWQVGGDAARRFVITDKRSSYAAWRSNAWARDLSVNCGVIGAAYFWSSSDLSDALEPWHADRPTAAMEMEGATGLRRSSAKAAGRAAPEFNAGTGMGERVAHPVRTVSFDHDAGMYDPSEALVLYYDFGGVRPLEREPRPIPLRGNPERFAPEMPQGFTR